MDVDKAKSSPAPRASSDGDWRHSRAGLDPSSLPVQNHASAVNNRMSEPTTKVNSMTNMNRDCKQQDAAARSEPDISPLRVGTVSRRRLLKAGATVTPVILTLTSKPVLATTGTCPTGSALASLNVSGHIHAGVPCAGRTPGWWKNHTSAGDWPSPYVPTWSLTPIADKTTTFNQVFTDHSLSNDMTLLACVQNSATGGEAAVRNHIVAALLNAAKGWNTAFLSAAQVIMIWNNYKSSGGGLNGYWSPGSGVKLYADSTYVNGVVVSGGGGITGWLKDNMPL